MNDPAFPVLQTLDTWAFPSHTRSCRAHPCPAVDDGEPRSMNDPANLPFMEAIMRGQLPPELDPGDPNVQVGVDGVC